MYSYFLNNTSHFQNSLQLNVLETDFILTYLIFILKTLKVMREIIICHPFHRHRIGARRGIFAQNQSATKGQS